MRGLNRPAHYEKRRKKAKVKSTTFYLSKGLLTLLKDIAKFENISLSIMIERSLHYARNGNFKRANKLKKKTKIYTQRKHKFTNQKAKQEEQAFTKQLFD